MSTEPFYKQNKVSNNEAIDYNVHTKAFFVCHLRRRWPSVRRSVFVVNL